MTDTKPAYVRIKRMQPGIGADGNPADDAGPYILGAYSTRPWWRWTCVCGVTGGKYELAAAHSKATRHAQGCWAVRISMERDAIETIGHAAAAEVWRLRAEVTRLRDSRDQLTERLHAAIDAALVERTETE